MENKRVLLVSPTRPSLLPSCHPHLGLGLIAGKLLRSGFDVRILDYIVDRNIPSVAEVMNEFNPGIVGITINTAFYEQADEIIEEASRRKDVKILVGGPHATLYHEEIKNDKRIHYIFRGESEGSIIQACEDEILPEEPVVVEPARPDMAELPFPAFERCYRPDKIFVYPLQTSRGCPFACIFCEVSNISSKKWRPRPTEQVIEELVSAGKKFPSIKTIAVQDDNPAFNPDYFKDFIIRYDGIRKPEWEIRIANLRADNVDEEMMKLLSKSGCKSVCLGVEHANPEMFKSVNKGEKLEQIVEAARIVKQQGMELGFCFVIGLPGDSFEKTKDSVKFVKKNKADYVHWNVLAPHKGTKVRQWFEENGRIRDERNFTSFIDDQIYCDPPVCDSDSFKSEDVLRAHFWAVLSTNMYYLKKRNMKYVIRTALKYGFYFELIKSLAIQFYRKNFVK